jgi:hypothetical protein
VRERANPRRSHSRGCPKDGAATRYHAPLWLLRLASVERKRLGLVKCAGCSAQEQSDVGRRAWEPGGGGDQVGQASSCLVYVSSSRFTAETCLHRVGGGEWAMCQWRGVDDVAAVDVSAVWPVGGGGGGCR